MFSKQDAKRRKKAILKKIASLSREADGLLKKSESFLPPSTLDIIAALTKVADAMLEQKQSKDPKPGEPFQ